MAKKSSGKSAGQKHGWRSGLEGVNAAHLKKHKVPYRYEKVVVPYVQPEKLRRYTPDFLLKNGIIIETKGRFVTADRQKHILVKKQHPDLEIRFVFSNPNQRISKQSATTYAMWCQSKGFLYAKGLVPIEWTKEPVFKRSKTLALSLMKGAA